MHQCIEAGHGQYVNTQVFQRLKNQMHFIKGILKKDKKGFVAFDLATHRGYDSDHERVQGDVEKQELPSIALNMKTLLMKYHWIKCRFQRL